MPLVDISCPLLQFITAVCGLVDRGVGVGVYHHRSVSSVGTQRNWRVHSPYAFLFRDRLRDRKVSRNRAWSLAAILEGNAGQNVGEARRGARSAGGRDSGLKLCCCDWERPGRARDRGPLVKRAGEKNPWAEVALCGIVYNSQRE